MTPPSVPRADPAPDSAAAASPTVGTDAALAGLLFATAGAGVGLVDRALRYVRVNDALAAMNGLPAPAHVGRLVREVLPPAAADLLEPLLRRVLETGEPVTDLPLVAEAPAGVPRHFLASYHAVRDPGGAISGVAAFVAERTPAEVVLRETAERLRRVDESGIVGLFFWSVDGGIHEANDAFLSMLGYTQDDLAAGRVDWRRMTPPEYAAQDAAAVHELLTTGRHGQYPKEYLGRDGRRVPVVVTSAMLEGSTDRGVCVCLDDRARRAAEARLGRVLAQTPAAVAVLLGPDHVVQSTNEMFLRLLGRRDYVGRPAREGAPELVGQGFLALMDEVYRTGVPFVGREAALVWDRDGDGVLHEGHFDFVYQPILDAGGAVEGILVFAVEVTAQVRARRATEAAAARTARLQALTAALAGAVTVDDAAAVVVAEAVEATGANSAVLAVRAPGADEAVIVRQTGLDAVLLDRYARFPLDAAGPAARCLRTGEPQWAESRAELMAADPEVADAWERLGAHALAAVPLAVAGEVVGVMSFTFDAPRALAAEDRDFFLALGRQAAQAVERARLFEAERAARAEAEAAGRARAALLADEAALVDTVRRVGATLASELDVERIVQAVTDEATKLTGAQFGAFFYTAHDPHGGGEMTLYTLSGVPHAHFSHFPHPRATPVFGPTFRGEGVVRSADITAEPQYGRMAPHHGMPRGHLPVRSYLAVPVRSRTGAVLGGLFFGHERAGVFTEREERLVVGVAGWTAVAMDNARLYAEERQARAAAESARARLAEHARELEEANRQLQDTAAELELHAEALQDAAAALEERTDEAEAARAAAETANRAKSDFLAVMSHELRTPLTAIGGYADLIAMGIRGPVTAEQQDDLARLKRAQQHLLGVISDVLEVANLEAGRTTYSVQPVRLGPVLAGLGALVSPQAAERRVAYEYAGCPDQLVALADPGKLRQVVLNLLSNAVKFTPAGGAVRLSCGDGPAGVTVAVHDSGIGIPAEKLEAIFAPFVQLDQGLTRAADGTGLGLSISRDLARGMGGELTVESAPGAGSTFTLTLRRG